MFEYEGKYYKTYYQLSKAMGIDRNTIRYRHEKLGIPIDKIRDYVAEPRVNRLKFVAEKPTSGKELEIINYPRFPEIPYSLVAADTDNLKQEILDWSEKSPELLLKRAIHLLEEDYTAISDLLAEQSKFAYGRENNELKQKFYQEVLSEMKVCGKNTVKG